MNGKKCESISIVLGAAAPVPYRSKAAEEAVVGKTINEQVAMQAAKKAMEMARPLSMNNFKVPLFEAIIKEGLLNLA